MRVADELVPGVLLAEPPEEDNDDNAQGETNQGLDILTPDTPHLLGADGSPKHGGGEEGVDAGAEEAEGGVVGADVLEMDLVLDDGDADKG